MSTFDVRPLGLPVTTSELGEGIRERQTERDLRQRYGDSGRFLADEAITSAWSTSWMARQWGLTSIKDDPDFLLTEDLVREYGDGIDPTLWEAFGDARSLDHMDTIREQMLKVSNARGRLRNAGWVGAATEIAASILDPGFIIAAAGAGLVSGGAGTVAAGATRGARVLSLIRTGLVAAGADAAVQSYIQSRDPEQGLDSVVYAGLGSFALGTAIDGSAQAVTGWRRALAHKAAERMKAVEASDAMGVQYAMGAASPLGIERASPLLPETRRRLAELVASDENTRAYFKQHITEDEQRALLDRIVRESGLEDDTEFLEELAKQDPAERFYAFEQAQQAYFDPEQLGPRVKAEPETTNPDGAEADMPPEPPRVTGYGNFDGSWIRDEPTPKAGYFRNPLTYHAILGNVDDEATRAAAYLMMPDPVFRDVNRPQGPTAFEVRRRTVDSTLLRFYRHKNGYDSSLKAFMASRDIPIRDRAAAKAGLDERVIRAIQEGGHIDPVVNSLATHTAATFERLLRFAKDHHVPGFESVEYNRNYFPSIFSPEKARAASTIHGRDEVVRWFRESLDIDAGPEDLDRIAEGMTRIVESIDEHPVGQFGAALGADNPEALAEVLRVSGVVDEDVIERALKNAEASKAAPESPTRFGKRATPLKRDNVIQTRAGELSLRDLIETDLEHVVGTYTSSIVGSAVSQEVYRNVGARLARPGAGTATSFAEIRGELRQRLYDSNKAKGMTTENATLRADRTLDALETMDKAVRGVSQINDHLYRNTIRRLRLAVAPIYNGSVGLANLGDLAPPIAQGGIRATWKAVPSMRAFQGKAIAGKLDDEFFDFVDGAIASGYDRAIHRFSSRAADGGAASEVGNAGIDKLLFDVNRFSNDVNGLSTIDRGAKTGLTNIAEQKWLHTAKTGKIPNKRRLASMGMTPAMADRVKAMILSPEGTIEHVGETGRRTQKLTPSRWTDREAANAFLTSLDRWSTNAVIRGNPADYHPWMVNNEIGKMISQFRAFPFLAWDRGLIHNLQVHDAQSAATMIAGFGLASLVYIGRTYLDSLGREDAEQYRQDNLAIDRIAAGGARYAGWTSFIPDLVDTAVGERAFFNNRMSGLSSGFLSIDQAPGLSTLNKAIQIPGSIIEAVEQGHVGQDEYRLWTSLLWLRRQIGVKQMIDAFGDTLPED